jgi:hypothetical protein
MAKRDTGAEGPPEKPEEPQAPKIEINLESLIATAIAAVVVKPAKQRRGSKPNWKP